jgi:hypothetical protein
MFRRGSAWTDSIVTLLQRLYSSPTLKDIIDENLQKNITSTQLGLVMTGNLGS